MRHFSANSVAVAGIKHEKSKPPRPCEDSALSKQIDGLSIIALADGMGSASKAELGSKKAVEITVQYLEDYFDDFFENTYLHQNALINTIIKNEMEFALEIGCKLEDLYSTLLFVAIKDNRYIYFRIGDGNIIALYEKESEIVSSENKEEASLNETHSVTEPYSYYFAETKKGILREDFLCFFIMSDGGDPLINKNDPTKYIPQKIMRDIFYDRFLSKTDEEYHEYLEYVFETVIKPKVNGYDDSSMCILGKKEKCFIIDDFSLEDIRQVFAHYYKNEKHLSQALRTSLKMVELLKLTPCHIDYLKEMIFVNEEYISEIAKILIEYGLIKKENDILVLEEM